jgi:hypothetical protein
VGTKPGVKIQHLRTFDDDGPALRLTAAGQQDYCRDLDKIALTVPSGNPVLFAIFRAPIPASWLAKERSELSLPGGAVSRVFFLWLALP